MASAKDATRAPEGTVDEVVNTVVDAEATVTPRRYFTIEGRDPFDEIEWELRDAIIPGKGGPAFEQRSVEFPKFWSQTATNIVSQKYFRGRMASPERERSVKEMIGRVADTIAGWGRQGGYFASEEEADTFHAELKAVLVNQIASFNSPVWFNVGFEEAPQCSACQPHHALVATPEGMVPIGRLVEEEAIGRTVYDPSGTTRIVAVKANGLKEVFRVTLRNGNFVEATGDHVVKAVRERRTSPAWLRVDELEVGMRMHLHPHRAKVAAPVGVLVGAPGMEPAEEPVFVDDRRAVSEAALAGWLQADGFVGQYAGANRSLTIEFIVATDEEHAWVTEHIDVVFPDVHRHERTVETVDETLSCRRIRLYGETLREFVEAWQLQPRGTEIRVPDRLWTASHGEIAAYLRSVFQADGYVTVQRDESSERGRVAVAVIGERWTEDIQLLLNTIGIYSRRLRKNERRDDRHDLHEVQISIGSERARFAEIVGFLSGDKQRKLLDSLGLRGQKRCPDLREEEIVSIESVGVQEVFDIQTESGEYLSNNVAVHNCFILSIDDSMESILDWIRREGVIFRGGSGSGLNLSKVRSSKEQLSKGGYASGPVSFMRGADASAGTIKSGGKTRRAAKMVVLDVDHPDVDEFIWCKAKEERKARVLEAAGYDMSLDSPDWASIQYQNANNSVRVTDAFMEAVVEGKQWNLTARTDGTVIESVDARALMKDIAAAAWECADPGVQYDTTINAWHTSPNTGRINASNPCSEYMHIDDSACNLSSLNLLKFRREDGEFDVEMFEHAVDVMFLAQEIVVGYSSYPTPEIGRNALRFRQLGLGYANLGALLMARGLPYDSDEGRAYAAAITALMTGRAYRKSAEVSRRMGPHAGYRENAAAMLGVIAKHRASVGNIQHSDSVPADLLTGARRAWDEALEIGEAYGFRNAQATVLAPTGTISFMMDCDTTGVEPDFSLVKSKKLVGGGEITIVNRTVPMALTELGYSPNETAEVVAFVDDRGSVIGAPYLKPEHYPVFDCAIGERAIHYMGHVKMMGAVQPFISGAISKCVTAETLVSTADGLVRIGSLRQDEHADSFRELRLPLASLDGLRETDAFYYGGERETIEVVLGSGHRIVGTPNHRLLVAADGELAWKMLAEIEPGDQVATQYGDDLWARDPASFHDFVASIPYGSQKRIDVPASMSDELAFFLGAYVAEGHISRTNHTVRIANADDSVLSRLVDLSETLFGIVPRVARQEGKCPSVELSSKTLVEFLDYLGCGDRSESKRIPDAVLRSPRSMVLRFLEGLSLDSYLPASLPKWAICVASRGLLDDLQAVLTNLGVVHNRITKYTAEYDKSFDEVYAHGSHAQRLVGLLDFPEAHKRARAATLLAQSVGAGTADLVPGVTGTALYDLIPRGRSGRSGAGTGKAARFRHLLDPRTTGVSRSSLEAVATVDGVELPGWLQLVLERNLHFSPVATVVEAGIREVYDVSVPVTHAFVGNGIVNHNTVNLPEQTTVEEVSQLLIEAWQLGVKAIAIYRDNCKVAQPLASSGDRAAGGQMGLAGGAPVVAHVPQRRRLPEDRTEVGRKFRVGDYEGYIHVGLYEDGTPGDIFVDIAKDGTTMAGLMNSLMIAVSMGLQYGVPPEVYVSKLSHLRFEPSGLTNDADIRTAKSIVDYIFRWFGKKFLSPEQMEEAGILTPEVKARLAAQYSGEPLPVVPSAPTAPPGQTALFNSWEDAVECARCGGRMVRTGSCYTCRDCGTNTGCS